jgi:hypothetical protein
MTQTTFTDNVLIDGSQDIKQLRVQGHTTQTANPLQTWEDSAGSTLAQLTGDGRLIVGDDVTPDSLIEAHRLEAATSKPKRGIHSLGQIGGTLTSLVQWAVAELELRGSSAIDALHTALRVRASNMNTGTPGASAELRAADIEVINDASAGSAALTKATGLRAAVTNASGKSITEASGIEANVTNSGTITNAYGLRVKMNNSGTITNPYSIFTEGAGVAHFEDYLEVKRPGSVPGTPSTDFMRIYPKSDGKLYTKNWSGVEYDLTSSGGGSSPDYILIRDEKTSGTDGGTFTNGAWRTRTLNTEVTDTGNHASLASNQITLAAGTYECFIRCPGYEVGPHQTRLQNITDTATTLLGTTDAASNSDFSVTQSIIIGRFTIATSKTFEIQHQGLHTRSTDGFGRSGGFGTEIYTIAEFRKVA